MNSKKILTLVLALAMVLTLLAGCGSSGKESSSSGSGSAATQAPATEAPAPATEAPATEEVPTGVVYPLADPADNVEFDVFMAMAGFIPLVVPDVDTVGFANTRGVKIIEEATGVHLNWTLIDQDSYADRFQIMIAGGEYPDILGAPDNYYTGGTEALLADEICVDMAPYLESCLPDFKIFYDEHETYAKQITSDNGQITTIYAFEEQSTQGLQIRQDWLDQVGLDIPVTYDDVYGVLTAFKTELNVKYPMVMTKYFGYSGNGFVGGYETCAYGNAEDMAYYVEDGVVKAGAIDDKYKEYLVMINKWYEEGLIGDVSLNIFNEMQGNEYVTKNEVGFWQGQSDTMGESTKAQAGGTFNAQPLQQTVRNAGDTFKLYENAGQKNQAGGWGISTACEDPEMAMKLINWLWTEEGFITCNYGEEGVTFNYVNGEVVFTDIIVKNPNGFPALFNSCSEIIFFDLPFDFSITRKGATLSNDAEWASQTVWRTGTSGEMYYPINSLSIEESEQYAAIYGDIHTYASENITKFITGDKSLDEWDAYVQQLLDLGIEDLVALKQAAYDRYLLR